MEISRRKANVRPLLSLVYGPEPSGDSRLPVWPARPETFSQALGHRQVPGKFSVGVMPRHGYYVVGLDGAARVQLPEPVPLSDHVNHRFELLGHRDTGADSHDR